MSAPVPQGAVDGAVGAAREYLRIAGGQEDAMLGALARAAFALGEQFTGASLVERAFEDVVAASGAWTPLLREPVTAVEGMTGLPVAGAPFVLPAGAYAVEVDAGGRGRVRVTAPGAAARVAVSYRAGLAADWEGLPAGIAHGVVMLIAHLFDARGRDTAPPAAVSALWRPYRRMKLAGVKS
ncbi:MAG TPA: hypothetical protein VF592_08345 [Sphingomonas sp.]|uniref:head-tail connector protein n=1 Tax=Sphingomonas sp. TaxID=28214 RepID=UPI002EDAA430